MFQVIKGAHMFCKEFLRFNYSYIPNTLLSFFLMVLNPLFSHKFLSYFYVFFVIFLCVFLQFQTRERKNHPVQRIGLVWTLIPNQTRNWTMSCGLQPSRDEPHGLGQHPVFLLFRKVTIRADSKPNTKWMLIGLSMEFAWALPLVLLDG